MAKQLHGLKFHGLKFHGLKFYGLKNCDSCRAALKALDMAGMQVEFQDVRDDGVPADVLRLALEEHGADRVINRRSTTWRSLDQAARDGDPVDLLTANPALMKRPLIVLADGATTIGWDDGARGVLGL
jgi:Spx/MgsR family transcriptional regulator